MEISAKTKYLRMSPRKVRLVVDLVRKKQVNIALDQLKFMNKGAALPISKLVKSAIANAVHNFDLEESNLYIKEIRVDEGPTLKRWMPRAHGRATPLRKRTSHIALVLGEIKDSGKKKAKQQKIAAPVKLGEKAKEDEGVKIGKKDDVKKIEKKDETEKNKKIIDPRGEGRGKNTKIEGASTKGFGKKVFRRKSG